jgi:hypothetical protein
MKLLGIISVSFEVTDQQIFCIRQTVEINCEYNETVHQLFIYFKQAYDTFRKEVLHKILMEFGVPMKQVRMIKMCYSTAYGKDRADK